MCGEQPPWHPPWRPPAGSPPRVRGTDLWSGLRPVCARITPACAGNRPPEIPCKSGTPDHPRVCGEQLYKATGRSCILGSPPRVRGTGKSVLGPAGKQRITPACAGNRFPVFPENNTFKDHPRVCGEQAIFAFKIVHLSGSPPRVRGTVCSEKSSFRQKRITPACAGNRACAVPPAPRRWDHPRVCGEQACSASKVS